MEQLCNLWWVRVLDMERLCCLWWMWSGCVICRGYLVTDWLFLSLECIALSLELLNGAELVNTYLAKLFDSAVSEDLNSEIQLSAHLHKLQAQNPAPSSYISALLHCLIDSCNDVALV